MTKVENMIKELWPNGIASYKLEEFQVFIADFLDKLTTLTAELEAELEARKQQYEYYRNKLLTFNEMGGGY